MTVQLGVTFVEPVAGDCQIACREPARRRGQPVQRHPELVTLAGVAHIQFALEGGVGGVQALVAKLAGGTGLEGGEDGLGMFRRHLIQRPQFGLDVIVHHVGA